ncbi:methyltransferase family protein [Sphingomonas sp.]|uniref:methyltransferase family protein n=1 Tax=Sphingomonas sp. TaxID=28214 RepID=UPI003D6D95CF
MDAPQDPAAMSPAMAIAYAIGLPVALLALVFAPVGSLGWRPGWIFIAVLVVTLALSTLVVARLNPVIFRARSRFQPGTKGWDKALLWIMLPAMIAIIPLATLDAGRMHWSAMPLSVVVLGYILLIAGIAGTGWAQAVNPFFEPGVRIQSERHQRVIDSGPYRVVRHPGYISALLMFWGLALALGSCWATIPAAIASAVLVLRTAWEDRLLHAELPGYADYARRVRSRLLPGIW